MIKFSEFFDEFVHIVNGIEMNWVDLKGTKTERLRLKSYLSQPLIMSRSQKDGRVHLR